MSVDAPLGPLMTQTDMYSDQPKASGLGWMPTQILTAFANSRSPHSYRGLRNQIPYGSPDLCAQAIFVRRLRTENVECSSRRSPPNGRPIAICHNAGSRDRSAIAQSRSVPGRVPLRRRPPGGSATASECLFAPGRKSTKAQQVAVGLIRCMIVSGHVCIEQPNPYARRTLRRAALVGTTQIAGNAFIRIKAKHPVKLQLCTGSS